MIIKNAKLKCAKPVLHYTNGNEDPLSSHKKKFPHLSLIVSWSTLGNMTAILTCHSPVWKQGTGKKPSNHARQTRVQPKNNSCIHVLTRALKSDYVTVLRDF